MVYLKRFDLIKESEEQFYYDQRNIHTSYYPFGIFNNKEFDRIEFDDITIFYGNNGSGKTTLLNIIGSKINAGRNNSINKGTNFDNYVKNCKDNFGKNKPEEINFISSDDIFEYMIDLRSINTHVNRKKEDLAREYLTNKYDKDSNDFTDYLDIRDAYSARKQSMSRYIRDRLVNNSINEMSNGESALMIWERDIHENGIYILDEPENSLSAVNILKLKKFIEDSARFYNCQFIISTHSPFLLNLEFAKIYDLDSYPVSIKKWNELENVRVYYDFFMDKKDDFI